MDYTRGICVPIGVNGSFSPYLFKLQRVSGKWRLTAGPNFQVTARCYYFDQTQ